MNHTARVGEEEAVPLKCQSIIHWINMICFSNLFWFITFKSCILCPGKSYNGCDQQAIGCNQPDTGCDQPNTGCDQPDTGCDQQDTGRDQQDTGHHIFLCQKYTHKTKQKTCKE